MCRVTSITSTPTPPSCRRRTASTTCSKCAPGGSARPQKDHTFLEPFPLCNVGMLTNPHTALFGERAWIQTVRRLRIQSRCRAETSFEIWGFRPGLWGVFGDSQVTVRGGHAPAVAGGDGQKTAGGVRSGV